MSEFADSEVYPNSPLAEVICEIRFPGEMEVECRRDQFWEDIRNEYPHILVPKAAIDKPPALQPYRFQSESKNRKVSVALNSIALSDTAYCGHESFTEEFLRVIEKFRKRFKKINKISRVGWRYVNIIPFVRDDDAIPIGKLLNVELLMPENALATPKMFDFRIETQLSEGIAIVRLASISRADGKESSQEAILLDIDFGCEHSDLSIKNYLKESEFARKHNRSFFERLITDDYRKYLRGETL